MPSVQREVIETVMRFTITILTVAVLSSCPSVSHTSEVDKQRRPLHELIDQLIAAGVSNLEERSSPLSSDAEFLRRVYLDLTGRTPTSQQARKFLGSTAPDKRTKLIDRLLVSPEHVRHMQYVFDVMLMGRRPEKHITLQRWNGYLYEAFRENKTWIQLTREILTSDGAAEASRPAARFLLDRELNAEEAARDIAQIFLGRDLECVECHKHPEVGEYRQRHLFGILAFLNRSYLFEDSESKLTSLGERATGVVKFTSVWTNREGTTSPRVLDLPAIDDPSLEENPYHTEPGTKTRGIPKYSRRLQLASAIVSPDNRAYQLNIANRLWAMLIGRGLVEPVDMFHAANPPSHPELLELMADDLLEHGYDMRRMIREIMLSKAYQRSSKQITNEELAPQHYYVALSKPLSSEDLAWSMMQATGVVETIRMAMAERLSQEHPSLERTTFQYAFQLEQAICEELQEDVEAVVEAFALGDEFSRSEDIARRDTFLKSGPLLTEWLQPSENSLVNRLQKMEDASSIAEELYLSVLTRMPTKSETKSISEFLKGLGDDQIAGLQGLVRSMLCSVEYRFNH
jgi:hypothetical protein